MAFNKFVEDQIQKGISEGLFDNLKGSGKPINMDDYFNTPEDLRLAYSVLKNGNIIPPEIEILKDIERLKEQLAACTDDAKKKLLNKQLNEKILNFDLTMERYKRKR